jgi:hypothetical protein
MRHAHGRFVAPSMRLSCCFWVVSFRFWRQDTWDLLWSSWITAFPDLFSNASFTDLWKEIVLWGIFLWFLFWKNHCIFAVFFSVRLHFLKVRFVISYVILRVGSGAVFDRFYGPFIASLLRKPLRMKDFSAFSCAHSGDFEWVLAVSESREGEDGVFSHILLLLLCAL